MKYHSFRHKFLQKRFLNQQEQAWYPDRVCENTALDRCILRHYRWLSDSPFRPAHRQMRAIYVHIPKAGGNSVTRILYHVKPSKISGHHTAWEYQAYDPTFYDSCYVFALVRHPLTRMRSAFYYLKNGGKSPADLAFRDQVLAPYDSFLDFVAALEGDDTLRRRVLRWLHFIPQSHFLCDAEGKCIVPHIFRMENFDHAMRQVCDALNQPYVYQHCNKTPKSAMAEEDLRGAAEALCRRMYPQDYALLGYSDYEAQMSD